MRAQVAERDTHSSSVDDIGFWPEGGNREAVRLVSRDTTTEKIATRALTRA